MKNTNKMSDFDKQWKDVFDGAEAKHPDGVWDRIDSSLSKQEVGYFKRRAFIYKSLAAASVIFALALGLFSINYYLDQNAGQLTSQSPIENVESSSNREALASADDLREAQPMERSEIAASEETFEVNGAGSLESLTGNRENNDQPAAVTTVATVPVLNTSNSIGNLTPIDDSKSDNEINDLQNLASLGFNVSEQDFELFTIDHIYLIPIMPRGSSKVKSDRDNTGFLAGLDFSTGLFDPNFQQGGSSLASSAGSTFANARVESVNDQLASFNAANKDFLLVRSAGRETKPEIAFSYGANFGFRVSRRFVLQSGIAYRKANTTTTTRGYFEDLSSNTQIPIVASYSYQLDGLSAVKRTDETDLNNQYEFASIPLRAGYIFLDRKINLTLMAGISSEFFLNNKIGGNEDQFETLTTSAGADSPYKSVFFNGTLGTMMGYTFAENYLITIEPSYRFAMNSFTRDDFYLNSYPSSFMLSFGVAYNFK